MTEPAVGGGGGSGRRGGALRRAAAVSLLLGLSGATAASSGAEAGAPRHGSTAPAPPAPAAWSGSPSGHFLDGPPARVTGGFGEDSCQDCHWDFEVGDPEGSLRVEGIPDAFIPGESYPVTVVLSRPGMESGGFQLAARYASDTTQAGSFDVAERDRDRARVNTDRDVQFVQHTLVGVPVERPHVTAWSMTWTAPPAPGTGRASAPDSSGAAPRSSEPPAILFHASAVAADGDESQVGDYVYVFEARTVRADP